MLIKKSRFQSFELCASTLAFIFTQLVAFDQKLYFLRVTICSFASMLLISIDGLAKAATDESKSYDVLALIFSKVDALQHRKHFEESCLLKFKFRHWSAFYHVYKLSYRSCGKLT